MGKRYCQKNCPSGERYIGEYGENKLVMTLPICISYVVFN
jgi:hypothetical protein